MKEDELNELIDKYLNGELPAEHPFHQSILDDPAVSAEIEMHKTIKEAVIDFRLMGFQKKMQDYHVAQKPADTFSKYTKFLLALLALVVTGVSLFTVLHKKETVPALSNNKSMDLPHLPERSTQTAEEKVENTKQPQQPVLRTAGPQDTKANSTGKQKNAMASPLATISLTDSGNQNTGLNSGTENLSIPANEPKDRQLQLPVIMDPCIKSRPKATVSSGLPCEGKQNGSITIAGVHGGEAPYSYSFDDGKTFQSAETKGQLLSGSYSLKIRDKNNCTSVVDSNYYLSSRNCPVVRNLSFNPQYGILDIPREIQESGRFILYDKTGKVLVSKTIHGSDQLTWDGMADGAMQLPGMYLYTIQYEGQKLEQGSITIIY